MVNRPTSIVLSLLLATPALAEPPPTWDMREVKELKRTRTAKFTYTTSLGGKVIKANGLEKEVYRTTIEARGEDGQPTRWVRDYKTYVSKDLFKGSPSIYSAIKGARAIFKRSKKGALSATLTKCRLSLGADSKRRIAYEPLRSLLPAKEVGVGKGWDLPAEVCLDVVRLISDDWALAVVNDDPAFKGTAKLLRWKKGKGTLELTGTLELPEGYQGLPGGGGFQKASGELVITSRVTFAKGRVTKVETRARVEYLAGGKTRPLEISAELKYTWK